MLCRIVPRLGKNFKKYYLLTAKNGANVKNILSQITQNRSPNGKVYGRTNLFKCTCKFRNKYLILLKFVTKQPICDYFK